TIEPGRRDWGPIPMTGLTPKAPTPNARIGFSVLIYAPNALTSPDVHEVCNNTAAHCSFMERLFNEAEPNFGKGEVPVVVITGALPVRKGKGHSRDIEYRI